MTHLRHLTRPLVVIALLAIGLALAVSSPAGAQSDIKVFKFESAETDADWEVQITAQALGGCNPPNARAGYVTSWLGPDEEDGEVLDPGVCNYRISAVARQVSNSGQLCTATVKWGTGGTAAASITTANRGAEVTVVAEHATPAACSAQPVLAITIDPEDVVEPLPTTAQDSNLQARAERAAVITEFRVKVTPKSASINRSGCDQTLDFFVHGDGEEEEKALGSIGSGVTCEFTIKVTEAPPPFQIAKPNGTSFSTADKNINTGQIEIDLSEHVRLPYNRIVIIQDVTNNPSNQGTAAYKITSVCAGVAALPPIATTGGSGIYTLPGGQTVASLNNGRFTVHSPNFANFGPGASYGAVATSTTSDEIGGCAVTATVEGLPAGCTVAGGPSRTLTWTSANPLQAFDFEFDIYCGGAQPPDPEIPPPPPTTQADTSTGTDTTTTSTAPDAATDTVRLVARLLENGKIEFGLQQWQHDSTWSDRIFPRARLFPADTAVGRWLVSSAIRLSVAASATDFADDTHVRIIARKQSDGRVEFGLQQSDDGGDTWGERMLPQRRFFPASASVLRWLGSSNITVDS
ncbi:MAG: hypothetical protein F4062_02350 [Acidimicrobiia bacterium]|nr:hypothetical protein [Acidimicrobiia bacterium]